MTKETCTNEDKCEKRRHDIKNAFSEKWLMVEQKLDNILEHMSSISELAKINATEIKNIQKETENMNTMMKDHIKQEEQDRREISHTLNGSLPKKMFFRIMGVLLAVLGAAFSFFWTEIKEQSKLVHEINRNMAEVKTVLKLSNIIK